MGVFDEQLHKLQGFGGGAMKANRPPFDADPLVIIIHCLGRDHAYIEAWVKTQPSPDDECGDHHDTLTDAVTMTRIMRLPHDPKQHQQPHDLARVLRRLLPIHRDASDCEDEIVVNRMLSRLVRDSFMDRFEKLPYEQALQQVKESAVEINHYFGSPDRATREARMQEVLDLLEWFADTECDHRPDGTVDVEAAALRKYRKGIK